ncbi:MAG: hypothetical protein JSV56_12565, partial [Methanomassiliicoccales archaeon]
MMGVIILIMGSFSVVYIASINRDHVVDRIEDSDFHRIKNVVSLVHEEVKTQAYYRALSAVYTATQVKNDQKKITPLFNASFSQYINESFPKEENNYLIKVENYTTGLFFCAMNTKDIVPTNESEPQTLKGKEKEVESTTVSNEKAGEFNETSGIAYYSLNGMINYTLQDTKSARYLRKSMHMEKRVDSAFPLLSSKLNALDFGTKGSSSPVPRTVKYILTTLAQYRVLQGYGMSPLASLTFDIPQKDTSSILTSNDVELALNLALLLETARLYRTYDEEALKAMDEGVLNWKDGDYVTISRTGVQDLVKEYVNNGTIDAADIIAIYLSFEEKSINIEAILAQALNAVADQFILKYLEYYHMMGLADFYLFQCQLWEQAFDLAGEVVEDIMGLLTGQSDNSENFERIKNWVTKTLTQEAGLPDANVMHDTKTEIHETTYTITLSDSGECQHEEDVDADPETPDELVTHSWSTELNYEIKIQSGDYPVEFTEKNILRDDVSELWYDPDTNSDFYNLIYGKNTNL